MTSSNSLPSNVRNRIAARLEKIEPEIQAIAEDLGEFGLNYITIKMGDVKVAIGSSSITFHNETHPVEQPLS